MVLELLRQGIQHIMSMQRFIIAFVVLPENERNILAHTQTQSRSGAIDFSRGYRRHVDPPTFWHRSLCKQSALLFFNAAS